ncbi:hypothetical protein DFP72DRAFT_1162559 [Ephemerocybe angulata]|uniref:NACHT domain-containing protein n=1 Tax=Ephemerocybe angulata TaxID=980116 RepID=A0A8H6MHP2_9AGAR|nr:hypothetical protein DFP72DRAFT_1162559 [Tulosesus angulatus]
MALRALEDHITGTLETIRFPLWRRRVPPEWKGYQAVFLPNPSLDVQQRSGTVAAKRDPSDAPQSLGSTPQGSPRSGAVQTINNCDITPDAEEPTGTIIQDSRGSAVLEEDSYLAALDFLAKHMACGAIHDSKERCDAPKCMPETRVAVQDEILSWVTDGHTDADPKRILWVTGPAGTGKTAILGTIAERCKEKGMLAATFFFSNFSASLARRSKTYLVATLAYQLLQHERLGRDGGVRAHTCQAIRRDPAVLQRRLQTQLDELILQPFRHAASTEAGSIRQHQMVIIIDGLDECDRVEDDVPVGDGSRERRTKEDEQGEILSAILHAAKDPSFPFAIIIASRPELAIREFFNTSAAQATTRELFLDEKYDPGADIRLFYKAKFAYIRRRFNLPPEWPGMEEVLFLVENASGQFIYATTVMRFVEGPSLGSSTQNALPIDEGLRTPHQRLARILELPARAQQAPGTMARSLEALDILYSSVLQTCAEPSLSMQWVCAIRILGEGHAHGGLALAAHMRAWLERSPGEEMYALGPLSSLLYIPPPDRVECHVFYHKSFVDFFEDEFRCGELYVSPEQAYDFVAQRYFQTMENHLDIGKIPSDMMYYTLYYSPQGLDLFVFSSEEAFKSAEPAMLACDVRRWAQSFARVGTHAEAEEGRRHYSRFVIARMFCAVHLRCTMLRCRRVCKHWREAILDVLAKEGWAVPSPVDLFRDRWISRDSTETMLEFFVPTPSTQE